MNYNFHTHTKRCRHATGDDEEYILRAIEGGVTHLGFSDHAPFVFPDGFASHYRVPINEAEEYVASLKELREKYKDKIHISIGFEMEYYPLHFNDMLNLARNFGAEYLILGQHYVGNEHPTAIPSTAETNDEKLLCEYANSVIKGIESNVFTYVAHPDIINFCGDDSIYKKQMTRICEASLKNRIPLEINFLGIRSGRRYPNSRFWEIVGEINSPVTFGFDAHTPHDAYDPESLSIANDMIKRFNLNYIGKPKIIKII